MLIQQERHAASFRFTLMPKGPKAEQRPLEKQAPELIAELARRYVWWSDARSVGDDRVIAQVMELGTYEDIRRIEKAFAPQELRDAMLGAPVGAISERSWDFWRGRLRFAGCAGIPQAPPARPFHAEML